MTSALSPREIQSRLRAGASVAEVAKEAGVEVDKISGFALPVMAERAHVTRTALAASVRRRGDGSGHRRLGDLIHERLQARGLDADLVEWDSWRQGDLRWRLVGLLDDQAASRAAEFVYDTKGRFSVADNADARWMIGEELPGVADDPDNENTIDFHDEFALVRATADGTASATSTLGAPGDDVPQPGSPYEGSAHTSELDELYDMLSGVSEDSVRIYLGLEDADGENTPEAAVREDGDAPSPTESPDDGVTAASRGATGGVNPDDSAVQDATIADTEGAQTDEDQPEARLAEELSEHPELPTEGAGDTAAGDTAVSDTAVGDTAAGEGSDQEPAAIAPEPTLEQDPSAVASLPTSPRASSAVVPEQDPLIQEGPPSAPKRKPPRKRASIPSWDEIMFGGPSRG